MGSSSGSRTDVNRACELLGMEDDRILNYVSSYREARSGSGKGVLFWASVAIHVAAVVSLIAIPLLRIDRDLPEFESMSTFLVRAPEPPPPPPPPPPPAPPAPRESRSSEATPRPVIRDMDFVVPVAIPDAIPPADFGGGENIGVPGGVEGGVPGGVVGGIVGGLSDAPRQTDPGEPVRLDFRSNEARPLVRIEPTYPDLAARARVQGVVVLEVLVDAQGVPHEINVLRTVPMLEAAATEAVRKWRWSPYRVLDRPVPFWVTVTVSFRLT